MNDLSGGERRLIDYLKKRDPSLSEKDIPSLLNDIGRFVKLAQRIYNEPQARVSYQDRKSGKKIYKDRVFTTTIEELEKVKGARSDSLLYLMREFHKGVAQKKHDR